MALSAISPGLFPDALVRDPPPSPPPLPTMTDTAGWEPEAVVFSSAPFRVLADLASAGLRQLATLLPALQQAAVSRADPVPLAHLAKAAGTAARQVADGHLALLAQGPDRVAAALPGGPAPRVAAAPEAATLRSVARFVGTLPDDPVPPRPNDELRALTRRLGAAALAPALDSAPDPVGTEPADPAQQWLSQARHLLRRTDDALEAAVSPQFRADLPPAIMPQADWASLQVAAARSQVASALLRLDGVARPTPPPRPGATLPALLSGRLPQAASLLGLALLLGVAVVATGTGWLSAAAAVLIGTGVAAWRIGRAAQGVRLDAGP